MDIKLMDIFEKNIIGDRSFDYEPEEEIIKGEILIGTIDDPIIRRLYRAFIFIFKERNKLVEFYNEKVDSGVEEYEYLLKLQHECNFLQRKYDIINNTFMVAVNEYFPGKFQDDCVIAVKKGWRLIKAPVVGDNPNINPSVN